VRFVGELYFCDDVAVHGLFARPIPAGGAGRYVPGVFEHRRLRDAGDVQLRD